MNVGYWNINKKNNKEILVYILSFLTELNLDLLFISEYENINFDEFKESIINNDYEIKEGLSCKKVIMIKKNNLDYNIVTDSKRFIISKSQNQKMTIASLHLQSNPNSNSSERGDTMHDLYEDLTSDEKIFDKVILLGDFNCLPTDEELVKRGKIRSIPFKEEVRRSDEQYMFYNPILLMLNEKSRDYGSFRYTGSYNSIIWFPFDQVMVSRELIDRIDNVMYLKKVGNLDLVNDNGYPNVSDHLPLFFTILEEE